MRSGGLAVGMYIAFAALRTTPMFSTMFEKLTSTSPDKDFAHVFSTNTPDTSNSEGSDGLSK